MSYIHIGIAQVLGISTLVTVDDHNHSSRQSSRCSVGANERDCAYVVTFNISFFFVPTSIVACMQIA